MARKLHRGARLVLASHNPGKLAELADLLRPHGISAISAGSLGLPEPEEDAPDFVGNARIKALAATEASGLPALADDSGFCVAALNGAPGVYSARWAGPAKDFSHAMERVNRDAADAQDRRAWFVAALCLAWPDGHTETFVGRVDGHATWPPRGTQGFGYDPMFVPTGAAATFGEMDKAEKHTLSHRARAFAQLMRACLLADAEPGEQRVEDVLHADAAGYASERP
jgi:XTP/dITP diphosphohydrolase